MEKESYVCISADSRCIGRAQSASASSGSFSVFFCPAKAGTACDLGNKNKKKRQESRLCQYESFDASTVSWAFFYLRETLREVCQL